MKTWTESLIEFFSNLLFHFGWFSLAYFELFFLIWWVIIYCSFSLIFLSNWILFRCRILLIKYRTFNTALYFLLIGPAGYLCLTFVMKIGFNQILILLEMLKVLVLTLLVYLKQTGSVARLELIFNNRHVILIKNSRWLTIANLRDRFIDWFLTGIPWGVILLQIVRFIHSHNPTAFFRCFLQVLLRLVRRFSWVRELVFGEIFGALVVAGFELVWVVLESVTGLESWFFYLGVLFFDKTSRKLALKI